MGVHRVMNTHFMEYTVIQIRFFLKLRIIKMLENSHTSVPHKHYKEKLGPLGEFLITMIHDQHSFSWKE